MRHTTQDNRKTAQRALWAIQAILALLFLFAGGLKLVLPIAALKAPIALPPLFLRFIGVCEVLGALGLVLPSVLRVLPILTPIAAGGLVIIMCGATTVTIMGGMVGPAVVPVVVGSLAAGVVYGRLRVAPIHAAPILYNVVPGGALVGGD